MRAKEPVKRGGNDGYILSDKSVWTFEIREDGKVVTEWTKRNGGIKDAITSESGDTITEIVNGEPVTFDRDKSLSAYDRIRRNDIKFEKIADGTSERLQVAFLITNLTTGEAHVLVTNQNGIFSHNKEAALSGNDSCGGYHVEYRMQPTGNAIHHKEIWHYEKVWVQ